VALFAYLQEVQRLLADAECSRFNTFDLISYINHARKQIAAEGQCIRVLPPTSGDITAISVTSAGSGYTSPIVTISQPDSPSGKPPNPMGVQATAVATLSGSQISAVTVLSGGDGYFQPTVTVSGGIGTGAQLSATVAGINTTNVGQDTYYFRDISAMVASSASGIGSILGVQGISLVWGNLRYTLLHYGFSRFQAEVRTYTFYQDIPSVFTQFGQGDSGSIILFPPPNQSLQMEWDCICLPQDLLYDTDVEAIPYPWTAAVKWYACYLAFSEAQKWEERDRAYKEFEKKMKRARAYSQPRAVTNWYGRR
jgi:hypothetical protein